MEGFHYTLPPDHLAQAFPFHLVLDASLQIVQVGDGLQKLLCRSLVGESAAHYFSLSRPKIDWNLEKILSKQQALFVLVAKDCAVNLKGQMLWNQTDKVLFFLGSVWVSHTRELISLGLKLKDFALHDATIDFLISQRTSQMALEDAQALTQKVRTQKEQVEKLLQHQERLTREADERAHTLEETLKNLNQAQLHLVQAEKMSALGQLMAGIAHEINNPLAFISGNLEYLEETVTSLLKIGLLFQNQETHTSPSLATAFSELEFDFLEKDLPKLLQSLRTGSDRITEIVKALQNFSRIDETPKRQVDIHQGLDNSLRLLQHRFKAQPTRVAIQIQRDYSASLLPIECFAGQLNQVFINILANAIDALETDTQVTPTIAITTSHPNPNWIKIEIADNGPGIPSPIQTRIFDPFFTTKPVGKGTGLGMSISRQIVIEQHGGHLYFHTSAETGTSFFIELPVFHPYPPSHWKTH
ncbi:MAG: ATP-binding protein [Cyanobacteria bacterium J06628_4]